MPPPRREAARVSSRRDFFAQFRTRSYRPFLAMTPHDTRDYRAGHGSIAQRLLVNEPDHPLGLTPKQLYRLDQEKKRRSHLVATAMSAVPKTIDCDDDDVPMPKVTPYNDATSKMLNNSYIYRYHEFWEQARAAAQPVSHRRRGISGGPGSNSAANSRRGGTASMHRRQFSGTPFGMMYGGGAQKGSPTSSFSRAPDPGRVPTPHDSAQMSSTTDERRTKIPGQRPSARDGHTGIVLGSNFFVFGGDRHRNPFNDFYLLDLETEFDEKGLII